jgi:hypothetical protein
MTGPEQRMRPVAGAAVILAVTRPAAFAAGPACRTHPAQDNLAQVKPPRIPALYDGIDRRWGRR